jgi:hypothetical protein
MPKALSSAFSGKEKRFKELKKGSDLKIRNDVQMVCSPQTVQGKVPTVP